MCRCIEGLKLKSMLGLFIGGVCVCVCVCVCVHVDRHDALFRIERVCGFLQISMSLDANTSEDIIRHC